MRAEDGQKCVVERLFLAGLRRHRNPALWRGPLTHFDTFSVLSGPIRLEEAAGRIYILSCSGARSFFSFPAVRAPGLFGEATRARTGRERPGEKDARDGRMSVR